MNTHLSALTYPLILTSLLLGGCGASDSADGGYDATSAPSATPAESGDAEQNGGEQRMTAAAWDDNLHWDSYLEYMSQAPQGVETWAIDDRILVFVTDSEGAPAPNAPVRLVAGETIFSEVLTGSDGRAIFHPEQLGVDSQAKADLAIHVVSPQGISMGVPDGDAPVFLTLDDEAPAALTLDLAFCIDTTGSMGDEISYISSTMEAISERIAGQFPDVDLRFGLVEYRDKDDAYVTRHHDFTGDLDTYLDTLGEMEANGGGDYPEDLNAGLHASVSDLSWDGDDAIKLLFLMTDAPAQLNYNQGVPYEDSLADANATGIRIYPVMASGADQATEYTLRQLAQSTLGQFIFITDHSGLGDDHKDPEDIDPSEYVVEYLDDLIVRVVTSELAGETPYIDPDSPSDVEGAKLSVPRGLRAQLGRPLQD